VIRRLCSAALLALLCAACQPLETQAPANPAQATENDTLRRRIAQMEEENRLREQYITEVTETLTSVQENLTGLRVEQSELQRQWSTLEQRQRVTATQRDELLQRIENVRGQLETNGAKLAEARARAEKADGKVTQLLPLIAQLQNDLTRRDQEVTSLRTTVGRLQVDLRKRDEVIVTQNQTIAERDRALTDQARLMEEAENERNRVYYRIDRFAALQTDKLIIREGGLFGSRVRGVWLPAGKLNVDHFTQADRREVHAIEVGAPAGAAQIITKHDPESFRHEALTPTRSVIRILDPEKFWAAGPFLIVGKR
jgi:uncharacterized protein (DUF3084 family)